MTTALALSKENTDLVAARVQEGLTTLMAHKQLIDQVVAQMTEGQHYGASFPGDTKKNLLKPGADYLVVAFQLVPEFAQTQTDLGEGHREISTVCVIKTGDGQRIVANGVGTCSTMEKKYRWRTAALKCPSCGQSFIIKGKDFNSGKSDGWLCWLKKGGCGAKFKDGDASIEKQERGQIENKDIADVWNTVMKISKKRAFVDAVITATGCSDQFTQDAEDMVEGREEAKPQTAASTPAAAGTATVIDEAKPAPPTKAEDAGEKLYKELDSAIGNAIDVVTLGGVWKEVMANNKLITPKNMIKLRDHWQARLTEPSMQKSE